MAHRKVRTVRPKVRTVGRKVPMERRKVRAVRHKVPMVRRKARTVRRKVRTVRPNSLLKARSGVLASFLLLVFFRAQGLLVCRAFPECRSRSA